MRERLTLPQHVQPNLQAVYESIVKLSPAAVLALHDRQKAARRSDPVTRNSIEESEKLRYALLLGSCVEEADLPVAREIMELEDSDQAWKRLFGVRRAKTLRNRYHAWKRFREYLLATRGIVWPTKAGDLINYASEMHQEGIGKSFLGALQAALTVLESAGKVPQSEWLSADPLWVSFMKSLEAEVTAAAPSSQEAPMYSVAMVVALELAVSDPDLDMFSRFTSWVALLMTWTSMRCDDAQHVDVETISISATGFRAVLVKTKTTGPDKRHRSVTVFVSRRIGFTGVDWLGLGGWLLQQPGFDFPRQFLVMDQNIHTGVLRQAPTAPYRLALTIRSVLSTLEAPKKLAGKWVARKGVPLMPAGLQGYHTGHSPRNFLTSLSAICGFSREERDFLGRWGLPKGSEGYTRTSRQLVQRQQETANQMVLEGRPAAYLEDELLDAFKRHVEQEGGDGDQVRVARNIWVDEGGVPTLGATYPVVTPGMEPAVDAAEPDDVPEPAAPARSQGKYFVTVSGRNGLRRLHLDGACHVKAHKCQQVRFMDSAAEEGFDVICIDCKRKMREAVGTPGPQEDSSDSDASTSSSD
jgi:hypothetical protein